MLEALIARSKFIPHWQFFPVFGYRPKISSTLPFFILLKKYQGNNNSYDLIYSYIYKEANTCQIDCPWILLLNKTQKWVQKISSTFRARIIIVSFPIHGINVVLLTVPNKNKITLLSGQCAVERILWVIRPGPAQGVYSKKFNKAQ